MVVKIGLGLLLALWGPVALSCAPRDIQVTAMRVGYVNPCGSSPCHHMKGVVTMRNRCTSAVGVQFKLTAYNKAGEAIATTDFWPASTKNIAPGEYVFSLDHIMDYEPSAARFVITPLAVRVWR